MNASPHPNDLLIRRKGRSLIPDRGARTRGEVSVKFPIESTIAYYTSAAGNKDFDTGLKIRVSGRKTLLF